MRLKKQKVYYKVPLDTLSVERAALKTDGNYFLLTQVSKKEIDYIKSRTRQPLLGIPNYICLNLGPKDCHIEIYPVPPIAMSLILHIARLEVL